MLVVRAGVRGAVSVCGVCVRVCVCGVCVWCVCACMGMRVCVRVCVQVYINLIQWTGLIESLQATLLRGGEP